MKQKALNNRIIILVLLLLSLSLSCSQKQVQTVKSETSTKPIIYGKQAEDFRDLLKVVTLIEERDFDVAIDKLLEYQKKDPNMRYNQWNIPIFLMECYQATGQFDLITVAMLEQADKLWQSTPLEKKIGHDYYDYVKVNFYAKGFAIEKAIELSDAMATQDFYNRVRALDSNTYGMAYILQRRSLIVSTMLLQEGYNNKIVAEDFYNEEIKQRISYLFDFINNTFYNKTDLLLFLAELLSFQYKDGIYHSDNVFLNDTFIKELKNTIKLKKLENSDFKEIVKLARRIKPYDNFQKAWIKAFAD